MKFPPKHALVAPTSLYAYCTCGLSLSLPFCFSSEVSPIRPSDHPAHCATAASDMEMRDLAARDAEKRGDERGGRERARCAYPRHGIFSLSGTRQWIHGDPSPVSAKHYFGVLHVAACLQPDVFTYRGASSKPWTQEFLDSCSLLQSHGVPVKPVWTRNTKS